MFEHVVNSVYIPSDDVISHWLDVFRGLLSGQFYYIKSKVCRQRVEQNWVWELSGLADMTPHQSTLNNMVLICQSYCKNDEMVRWMLRVQVWVLHPAANLLNQINTLPVEARWTSVFLGPMKSLFWMFERFLWGDYHICVSVPTANPLNTYSNSRSFEQWYNCKNFIWYLTFSESVL